ncbi:competence type IV pilus ATPase ComGA [Jeotgalibacillus soli]|uniref:Competence protein ComG n=1 Tax=Jeotgalibacillus soli TaxID=889306 RepID=A0A0C2R276_9BACL|nr:competence type IV pilus ATPase ComGA [Jeotgalibacillus soli]KIL44390.1 competence protein ComG [Jeotgalibacillus soli]
MSFGAEHFANKLLAEAYRQSCSDIHLLPRGEEMIIQFRIQGELVLHRSLPNSSGERLISHFKFKASLDIGEKRKPQSGSFEHFIEDCVLSLRISTLPASSFTESLVLRLLPQSLSIPIEKLSMFSNSAKRLLSLVHHSHGLLLFTGPTGSGKTTTLYSLVHYCSTTLNRNIITLEDPIERKQDHILQVQINERAGITYASGLRAVLRHDPDMIIVGEIRDAETAKIAARAALSGHLVLSTLHARNAKGAIYRMHELGVSLQELNQTLIGVTAQRLVKINQVIPNENLGARASVFEMISGKELQDILKEKSPGHPTPSLKQLMRKGVALGYVSEKEYDRWMANEVDDTPLGASYLSKTTW